MAIDLSKNYVEVVIDISDCEISDDFWAKQGDTGRGFIVKLVDKGQIVTPSGELVQLHLLKPDDKQVWINAVVTDGKFFIHLTNQSLMASGKMQGEFLISSMGKTKRTETFIIDVQPSLADGAYESTNEFGDLDILIQKIEQYAPSIEAWGQQEQARITAENTRVTSENTRITRENTRTSNETTRQTNETNRVSTETARNSAESTRQSQEGSRVASENLRISNESTRQTNESTRQTAESTRNSNETIRQSNETARQTNTATAITNVNNAVNTTVLIWKQSVVNFANIATTYPNPEVGWRVETTSDKKVYRYDGSAWVHISDNSSTTDSESKTNKGVPDGYAPLDSNAKVPIINLPMSGAVSPIIESNLAFNMALISNSSGKISVSDVSSSKLSFVKNVTSDVQNQIDGKANSSHVHSISNITDLSATLNSKANATHLHTSSDISDFTTQMNAKANVSHSHAISNVTGLSDQLLAKQDTVTGAVQTVLTSDLSPNVVVVTDINGKISESSVTSTEVESLVGVISPIQNQINAKADLDSPTFSGNVSGIDKTMVGLSEVDNTADLDKPISNAQQAVNSLKAPIDNPIFTGIVTAPVLKIGSNKITVSANAPASPAIGDIWIDI